MTMTERKKIEVYEDEYLQLVDDSYFLSCLRGAGVDSWEGYEEAMDEYSTYL